MATLQAGQRAIFWPLPLADGVLMISGSPAVSATPMQQFGSDRRESGHCADIVDRSKMT
jgi:hypothetical protein